MHIDFDRDRIMGELSHLESRLADLSDMDTDTIQEIFNMICRQEDFVLEAYNEPEKLTTGDINSMNEVNQKVMGLCNREIFSQLEESDHVRAFIQIMQTRIQEALALPLEIRTLIAQMADSPQLRQVAKVWKEAAETAVTEADLKRLEVFKSQYALPIREEEENAYSYLRRSLLTIVKAQDQYLCEELDLSGISPLTLLEILENREQKIEDKHLLKFCSLVFDDIQNNPEYWREKISERASEIEALSLGYKGLRRLPKEISEFKNVTVINLSNNQLTSLPEGISELTNLKGLNLVNNQLTSLPEGISELKNLEWLTLNNNQLTSLPEGISKLTKLGWLTLDDNQLTSLPEGISELINLNTLDLSHNPLTSEALGIVTELKNQGCMVRLD